VLASITVRLISRHMTVSVLWMDGAHCQFPFPHGAGAQKHVSRLCRCPNCTPCICMSDTLQPDQHCQPHPAMSMPSSILDMSALTSAQLQRPCRWDRLSQLAANRTNRHRQIHQHILTYIHVTPVAKSLICYRSLNSTVAQRTQYEPAADTPQSCSSSIYSCLVVPQPWATGSALESS
jgi:hypothetical protein